MEVKVIAYTPKPLKLIYTAGKSCTSGLTPQEIWNKSVSRENMVKFVENILSAGHLSVTEHVSFTFAVSGISRSCTHQLVRSRLASFSQQSQRYVRFGEDLGYVVPETINKKRRKTLVSYLEVMEKSKNTYLKLLKEGVPPEDARYLLPNAALSNVIITMNFREVLHTASLRLCRNAQWEIRSLFKEIKKGITDIEPFLGKKLIPKCRISGYCDELKSCGLMPPKKLKRFKNNDSPE